MHSREPEKNTLHQKSILHQNLKSSLTILSRHCCFSGSAGPEAARRELHSGCTLRLSVEVEDRRRTGRTCSRVQVREDSDGTGQVTESPGHRGTVTVTAGGQQPDCSQFYTALPPVSRWRQGPSGSDSVHTGKLNSLG